MKRILLTALAASLVTSAACGSPKVPDEQQAREYKSTETTEEETAEPSNRQEVELSQGAPSEVKATGPIATVDGKPIPAAEFNLEMQRLKASNVPPALLQQASAQIVQRLIDRRLIEDEIERENVDVTDAQIDERMQEVRDEFAKASEQLGEEASLEQLTQQLGISEEELRKSIAQSIAIEVILENRGVATPTDEEVRAFYDQNRDKFGQPEQIRVRHILVKVDEGADDATVAAAKTRAEKIQKEASKKGADFASLAKEKSEGPSAPEGGDLGYFPRGRMVPEFEKVAFALKKPGDVSEPVRTSFGWHVIKLEDKKESGLMPFEEVSEELGTQLKNQKISEGLVALLEDLRKSHTVEVHPENIAQ